MHFTRRISGSYRQGRDAESGLKLLKSESNVDASIMVGPNVRFTRALIRPRVRKGTLTALLANLEAAVPVAGMSHSWLSPLKSTRTIVFLLTVTQSLVSL